MTAIFGFTRRLLTLRAVLCEFDDKFEIVSHYEPDNRRLGLSAFGNGGDDRQTVGAGEPQKVNSP